MIIGRDLNVQAVEWASSSTNTRGKSLLRFLLSNNLCTLNIGNKPTFKNRVREEVIKIYPSAREACL